MNLSIYLFYTLFFSSKQRPAHPRPACDLCSTQLPSTTITPVRTATTTASCQTFAVSSCRHPPHTRSRTSTTRTGDSTAHTALLNITNSTATSAPCPRADAVASTRTPPTATRRTEVGPRHVTTSGFGIGVGRVSATGAVHVTGSASEITGTTASTNHRETGQTTDATGNTCPSLLSANILLAFKFSMYHVNVQLFLARGSYSCI